MLPGRQVQGGGIAWLTGQAGPMSEPPPPLTLFRSVGLEFGTLKTFVPHPTVGQTSQCPWGALPGTPRTAYSRRGRERVAVSPKSVPGLPTQNLDQRLDFGARSCCLGKESARGASLGSPCMSRVPVDLTTCLSGWQRGLMEGSRKGMGRAFWRHCSCSASQALRDWAA